MASNTYGRGGVAQSSAADRGPGGNYRFNAKEAEAYLSGQEVAEYRQALDKVGSIPTVKKSGKMYHRKRFNIDHKRAKDKAHKLRSIAAGRAFGEFSGSAIQHSKPWLARAPEGLISSQLVTDSYQGDQAYPGKKGRANVQEAISGDTMFSNVGLGQAARLRQGQPVDFGSDRINNAAAGSSFGGNTYTGTTGDAASAGGQTLEEQISASTAGASHKGNKNERLLNLILQGII